MAIARAAEVLSALCRSGVHLREAIVLAGEASGNIVVEKAFKSLLSSLTEGESLGLAMQLQPDVFPTSLVAYVQVGEAAGCLPDMLGKVSALYVLDAEMVLDSLPRIIEPLVFVVLGLVVGFIFVSVFIPLYGSLQFL
jgi:type IV pilus assembly protein PilC